MNVIFFFFLAFFAASPSAQVYKTVDENGKTVFSDTPSENSEKVPTDLRNIVPATRSTSRGSDDSDDGFEPEKKIRYRIKLISPTNNQRFGPAIKSFSISTSVNPPPRSDQYVVFYANDREIARSQQSLSTVVNITRNMRGKNIIRASLVDKTGRRLASSTKATVYFIFVN